MVFKPFTHVARQSISKSIIHGYTQSLVAASQSSYASQTLPLKFGQSNGAPAKLQSAFGGAHSGRAAPGKDGNGSDSVSSFVAAQGQTDDKEDKKYLFSKKILWSKARHQEQQKQLLGQSPEPIAELSKSRSASLIAEDVEGAEELQALKDEAAAEEAIAEEAIEEEPAKEETLIAAPVEEGLQSESSEATKSFNIQLKSLHEQGRWEEVTVLFQHVMGQGMKADVTTYNLFLDSTVRLGPRYISQVIDVHSAMLREKLTPSTTTYSILINFLAQRATRSNKIATQLKRDARRSGVLLEVKKQELHEIQDEAALKHALQLFYEAAEARIQRTFPVAIYRVLIEACAQNGRTEDMLNVLTHMELHGLTAGPDMVKSMLKAWGKAGDTRALTETFNSWRYTDAAMNESIMAERYQIYSELISGYMVSGDIPAALTFLEKVIDISHEHDRLEWLKQTVIEGFVTLGDIHSAQKWMQQLDVHAISNDWLASVSTRLVDQGELQFASQLYNRIDLSSMEFENQYARESLAENQCALLAYYIRNNEIEMARQTWSDLYSGEETAGPNPTIAVTFVRALFNNGCSNEALVILSQFSRYFLEARVPNGESTHDNYLSTDFKRLILQDVYEHMIVYLSHTELLTPSIALDIAGFSFSRCGALSIQASRRVLELFPTQRILGLTPEQLSLVLELQFGVLRSEQIAAEDSHKFATMCELAMTFGHPVNSHQGRIIEAGANILAQSNPELLQKWNLYSQRMNTPTMYQAAPVPEHAREIAEDPYWEKIDARTSDAIDEILSRSKYTKIADLKRMYRRTRSTKRTLRLTTLAEIISAASRGTPHQNADFIDEIVKNAKIDMPWMPQYTVLRTGWSELLNAMVAAQLALGRRDKASAYHEEMLNMGEVPTANTYGLYIVHLKGIHQTYDEASEAVSIFQRALSEGVTPTPFLFNAVIGKLAKARRVDDCLFYFALMRSSNIKPTSVTYGTMINALTRVGDEAFAEELFKEMESMANYKPRAAPYNSMIQFFITTKRDRSKVLSYYNRMLALGIVPTSHTYKLLIEAYATLEEPDMAAAEAVLDSINNSGIKVESSHHAALIHAKGCVLHDVNAAITHFESVPESGITHDSTLYQALLECLVANHRVAETPRWVQDMATKGIAMTPYIANTLIHGWTLEKNIEKAREVYEALGNANGTVRREPSTYEAMTRAYLAVEDREGAKVVANEMMGRGYPTAVVARVLDLVRMSEPVAA
jgi:pentatricopeptide repeat protein